MYWLPIAAHSTTMDVCKKTSEQTNKSLPAKKDNITVVRETGCLPGNPKIRFVYILEVDIPLNVAKQINFAKDMKPGVKNTFCSDPNIRALLNAFDVDHRYYAKDGSFAGSFLIQSSECS
jgi:hypothetical protein